MKKLLFLFLYPLCVCASSLSHSYVDLFLNSFQNYDFQESLQILDSWEIFAPEEKERIYGMKAATYLCSGDIETGKLWMEKFIQHLTTEMKEDPVLTKVLSLYYLGISDKEIREIKDGLKQPTRIKAQYLFGVGEALLGIAIMPFAPGIGLGLLSSGLGFAVTAGAEGYDNMKEWERSQQDRERIGQEPFKRSKMTFDSTSSIKINCA